MLLVKTHNNPSCNTPLEAGIDEAGRGCLAGPVAAAAVILPKDCTIPGLADSKLLSSKKRYLLERIIKEQALAWTVALVWQKRIDETNILQASLEAMAHAASKLKKTPFLLLIDGNQPIPADIIKKVWHKWHDCPAPQQQCIIGGDRSTPAISAASILAKTFRDRLMIMLAQKFPGYSFEKHKGYGTKDHLHALANLGPCSLHRLTFRKVLPVTREQISIFNFLQKL